MLYIIFKNDKSEKNFSFSKTLLFEFVTIVFNYKMKTVDYKKIFHIICFFLL